eukprot:13047382-Alexandrium_andersonii.AAC.1
MSSTPFSAMQSLAEFKKSDEFWEGLTVSDNFQPVAKKKFSAEQIAKHAGQIDAANALVATLATEVANLKAMHNSRK